MSEKRFEFYSDEDLIGVLDTVTGRTFNSFEIVDLLNEQQATIKQLESDKAIAEDYANIFEKENVKLRIENKKLKEENEQLKQSNDRFPDTVAKQVSLLIELRKENEQLKKARDKSDKFIVKKGLEIEFLEWCIK